jgi:ribosomal protein S27E
MWGGNLSHTHDITSPIHVQQKPPDGHDLDDAETNGDFMATCPFCRRGDDLFSSSHETASCMPCPATLQCYLRGSSTAITSGGHEEDGDAVSKLWFRES